MRKRFLKPPKNFDLGDNSRHSHEKSVPLGWYQGAAVGKVRLWSGFWRGRGETLGLLFNVVQAQCLEKSRPKPRKNSELGIIQGAAMKISAPLRKVRCSAVGKTQIWSGFWRSRGDSLPWGVIQGAAVTAFLRSNHSAVTLPCVRWEGDCFIFREIQKRDLHRRADMVYCEQNRKGSLRCCRRLP